MKQVWPNYSYSPTTNVLTLTGLNIDRDQLLLVTAADRGRIMYNFADSSVTASAFTSGANTALTLVATTAGLTTTAALVIYYDDQLASTTVTVSSLPAIAGTVTANILGASVNGSTLQQIPIIGYDEDITSASRQITIPVQVSSLNGSVGSSNPLPISGTVTIGSALPAGTNRIGVVTIGAGTVTIGAGTAQIGSVTASISGTVPVSGTFFQATQPVSLTTLPALVAGTAQIGSVTVGNTVTIAGTVTANPTGTQTIAGSVTLGASTSQIGTVTASISNSVTIGSLPAISGAVTVSQLPRVTFIDNSGSITVANSAVTVFASSTTRSYLLVQVTTGSVFLNVGATATTLNGISLTAGQGYAWETTIPQGIVSLISTTTSSLYVAKQA